jgi:hypothetical protein
VYIDLAAVVYGTAYEINALLKLVKSRGGVIDYGEIAVAFEIKAALPVVELDSKVNAVGDTALHQLALAPPAVLRANVDLRRDLAVLDDRHACDKRHAARVDPHQRSSHSLLAKSIDDNSRAFSAQSE